MQHAVNTLIYFFFLLSEISITYEPRALNRCCCKIGVPSNTVLLLCLLDSKKKTIVCLVRIAERICAPLSTILHQESYRRFNAIVSQLKMHYSSGGAFESLIASQLLKKEKYI